MVFQEYPYDSNVWDYDSDDMRWLIAKNRVTDVGLNARWVSVYYKLNEANHVNHIDLHFSDTGEAHQAWEMVREYLDKRKAAPKKLLEIKDLVKTLKDKLEELWKSL